MRGNTFIHYVSNNIFLFRYLLGLTALKKSEGNEIPKKGIICKENNELRHVNRTFSLTRRLRNVIDVLCPQSRMPDFAASRILVRLLVVSCFSVPRYIIVRSFCVITSETLDKDFSFWQNTAMLYVPNSCISLCEYLQKKWIGWMCISLRIPLEFRDRCLPLNFSIINVQIVLRYFNILFRGSKALDWSSSNIYTISLAVNCGNCFVIFSSLFYKQYLTDVDIFVHPIKLPV